LILTKDKIEVRIKNSCSEAIEIFLGKIGFMINGSFPQEFKDENVELTFLEVS